MNENETNLYAVPFIQYLRPNGRAVAVEIDRPLEVYRKAVAIIDAGYRLEVEELLSGLVSLTVGDDAGDYAYELHHNGPGLIEAVDRLILEFEIGGRK